VAVFGVVRILEKYEPKIYDEYVPAIGYAEEETPKPASSADTVACAPRVHPPPSETSNVKLYSALLFPVSNSRSSVHAVIIGPEPIMRRPKSHKDILFIFNKR
jgi:hypothetical protein